MKKYLLLIVIMIVIVSFVISNEENELKFLDDKSEKESAETVASSFFEKISKDEDVVQNFIRANSENKFVKSIYFPKEANYNYIECDELELFLKEYNEETFEEFSKCLNSNLEVPVNLELQNYILLKIIKTGQTDRLVTIFELAFNEADYLQYLEIKIDKQSSKIQIKSLNMRISQLNTDTIFLYKSSEGEYYYYADSLSDMEENQQNEVLKIFLNFLELLTEYKSEHRYLLNFSNITPQIYLSSGNEGLNLLSQTFQKVKEVWNSILSLSHSGTETKVKKLLIDRGYSAYDQTAQVQILSGVRREGLKYLYELLSGRLDIPTDKRPYIQSALEVIEFSDTNTWANFDIIFNIDDGAKVKYASVFSNRGKNDTFNFVITEIDASFDLSPDIMIITKKLSILGGLWSQSNVEIEYNPRYITNEELASVFSFFQVIVYKQVAIQFGINLELPN